MVFGTSDTGTDGSLWLIITAGFGTSDTGTDGSLWLIITAGCSFIIVTSFGFKVRIFSSFPGLFSFLKILNLAFLPPFFLFAKSHLDYIDS